MLVVPDYMCMGYTTRWRSSCTRCTEVVSHILDKKKRKPKVKVRSFIYFYRNASVSDMTLLSSFREVSAKLALSFLSGKQFGYHRAENLEP